MERTKKREKADEAVAPAASSGSGKGDRAADLARAAERLSLLVESSQVLNSTLDLTTLCDVFLGLATQHTGADRATLFLRDSDGKQLWSLLAKGLEPSQIQVAEGQGVAGWVAREGETVNLEDAHTDSRFNPHFDDMYGYRTRSLLAVPVKDREGRTIGVLELLNKHDGPFTAEDAKLLESLSVHAAIALQNARSHQRALEHQKVERDLALARTIHEGLLPKSPPRIPGLEIGVRHEVSFFVGGDYYDFPTTAHGNQIFVVADVEGKGAASALVVSNLQATLRTLVKQVHSLEGIMFHLNESLWENTHGERYVTLFIGLLDVARRGLHYINAGHVPPALVRAESEVLLEQGGTVVGLLPSQRYDRGFVALEPGDVVVACTDGITESTDAGGEEYGVGRLVAATREHRLLPAPALVDALIDDVSRFSSGGAARDDRVVMAVKALGQ